MSQFSKPQPRRDRSMFGSVMGNAEPKPYPPRLPGPDYNLIQSCDRWGVCRPLTEKEIESREREDRGYPPPSKPDYLPRLEYRTLMGTMRDAWDKQVHVRRAFAEIWARR